VNLLLTSVANCAMAELLSKRVEKTKPTINRISSKTPFPVCIQGFYLLSG